MGRLFEALPAERGINVAYAIGALGGLRTGEVLALSWDAIDMERKLIHIHEQVRSSKLGPVKDNEARFVPILDPLVPILAAYKLKTGGTGRLLQPAALDAVPARTARRRASCASTPCTTRLTRR